jgi:hypothetical protein
MVSVFWCCAALNPAHDIHGIPGLDRADPTRREARAIVRLSERLADLTSWLPASAWEDRQITAFVPSKYAICYRGPNTRGIGYASLDPSRVLGELPASAQALLRGTDKLYDVLSSPLLAKSESAEPPICSGVTIEDARKLEEILGDAGFVRSSELPPLAVRHRTRADSSGELTVSFESILPHGQWEAMGG